MAVSEAPRRIKAQLDEPIIAGKFFTNQQGVDCPTAKGVAMDVRKLPDLARAIRAAVEKATELGLLDEVEA